MDEDHHILIERNIASAKWMKAETKPVVEVSWLYSSVMEDLTSCM